MAEEEQDPGRLAARLPGLVATWRPGATRNRDVLRQARVQEAVVRSGRAPVAPVLFTDAGAPPEVPPLFAMAFVEGESFEPLLDATAELPPPTTIRHRQIERRRC